MTFNYIFVKYNHLLYLSTFVRVIITPSAVIIIPGSINTILLQILISDITLYCAVLVTPSFL